MPAKLAQLIVWGALRSDRREIDQVATVGFDGDTLGEPLGFQMLEESSAAPAGSHLGW
jgi:hypothetical protein